MPSHKPLHCAQSEAGAAAVCLSWSHSAHCVPLQMPALCAYTVDSRCLSEWAPLSRTDDREQVFVPTSPLQLLSVVRAHQSQGCLSDTCFDCSGKNESLSCPWQTAALSQMDCYTATSVSHLAAVTADKSSAHRTCCPH